MRAGKGSVYWQATKTQKHTVAKLLFETKVQKSNNGKGCINHMQTSSSKLQVRNEKQKEEPMSLKAP